jgi:hypothetical protein
MVPLYSGMPTVRFEDELLTLNRHYFKGLAAVSCIMQGIDPAQSASEEVKNLTLNPSPQAERDLKTRRSKRGGEVMTAKIDLSRCPLK